jgi:hypothetical protein
MKHLRELKPGQLPTIVTHPHLENACEPLDFEVVHERDCRGAVVCSLDNCPAARALRHGVTGVVDARVKDTVTYVEFEDGRMGKYMNPRPLSVSVSRFDRYAGIFPPGSYRLVPPVGKRGVGVHHARTSKRSLPQTGRRSETLSLRGARARKEGVSA